MTASELSALLDAHDVLVKAYVDSSLTFTEFVLAYRDFPHNYGLDGQAGTAEERVVLKLLGSRVAFHLRVSSVVTVISNTDAGQFLPAVGLMRIRELVARYPKFRAEPDFSA